MFRADRPSSGPTARNGTSIHHLFVSHGTLWQAHHGDPAWLELAEWGRLNGPWRNIVAISAHWTSNPLMVTREAVKTSLDEGFPPPLDAIHHPAPGAPELASDMIAALNRAGLPAAPASGRGLDHGAVIPLRALDPAARTPTVQISLGTGQDPELHVALGRALRPFAADALIVCSGGVVHNRATILPMSGRRHGPPAWAAAFDETVRSAMKLEADARSAALIGLTGSAGFRRAHPTPEHFTPLLVASGLGGAAAAVSRGFQWGTLSMASYAFEHPANAAPQTQIQGDGT